MTALPRLALICATISLFLSGLDAAEPPQPYGAVPTPQQVDWQRMEYYGFIHLGLNTYTGNEWGYGNENPKLFNPVDFNADQIVKLFKQAGMKGIILTAKHHDGFCLWPTTTTKHNITKATWKNGKGDLVKELADACKANGLKFGTYISPWDRNHQEYGQEGYLKDYYGQIRELLSGKYGNIFEIWFDGANGGDGWYGGAKTTRKIPQDYYNFPAIVNMIRGLQPNCIIWGAGHVGDARWGGSERGHVGYPHWATEDTDKPGNAAHGVPHGNRWVPAEGDTSIRSGWFWHERYNNSVKTPEHLLDVWINSVGRGANLILNVPPDKQGLIYPSDAQALLGFKKLRDKLYSKDFALGAKGKATNTRGNDKRFSPASLFDNDIETYWTTDDGNNTPSVEITLPHKATFDIVRLREQIRLGQRVESFRVDAWENGTWKQIIDGKTIGNQVMLPTTAPVTTDKLRLTITSSPAVPCISEFSLLLRPVSLPQPSITRQEDTVTIDAKTTGIIRFTTDGSKPTSQSPIFKEPISLPNGGIVSARVFDTEGNSGPDATTRFGISKKDWKVISATAGTSPEMAIDDKPSTFWHTHENTGEKNPPQSITVDMGKAHAISAFSYLPRQDNCTHGMTDRYIFEVSPDNKHWKKVAEGEFSNLRANPIEQIVPISNLKTKVRYFRFTGTRALDKNHISAAEISLFAK